MRPIETVDDVLSNIKVIASVPLSQNRFTDDYIRYLMNRETDLKVYPALVRQNQEYISKASILLSDDEGFIDIPSDAYLSTVISIIYKDTPLASVDREQFSLSKNGYIFQGDSIKTHYKNAELIVTYVPIARQYVDTSAQPEIITINTTLKRLTLNAPYAGNTLDIITPQGKIIRENVTKVNGSSNHQVVLDSIDGINVGDLIVKPFTTPFVNYTSMVVRYLERCVANCILEESQDIEMFRVGKNSEAEMLKILLDSLSSRGNKSAVRPQRRRF